MKLCFLTNIFFLIYPPLPIKSPSGINKFHYFSENLRNIFLANKNFLYLYEVINVVIYISEKYVIKLSRSKLYRSLLIHDSIISNLTTLVCLICLIRSFLVIFGFLSIFQIKTDVQNINRLMTINF